MPPIFVRYDDWNSVMKLIGTTLLLCGLGPVFLDMVGREIVFLVWIDQWGPEIGWAIKAALIAIGVFLLLPSEKKTEDRSVPGWTPHRRTDGYRDPVANLYNKPMS